MQHLFPTRTPLPRAGAIKIDKGRSCAPVAHKAREQVTMQSVQSSVKLHCVLTLTEVWLSHPHFIDEETKAREVKRRAQGHRACQWKSQGFTEPCVLGPGSNTASVACQRLTSIALWSGRRKCPSPLWRHAQETRAGLQRLPTPGLHITHFRTIRHFVFCAVVQSTRAQATVPTVSSGVAYYHDPCWVQGCQVSVLFR